MIGQANTGGEPRILVVDDDSGVRELITNVVRRAGHEVTAAATVQQGSREIRQGNLKLVILDLIMPGEDGIECLKILADSPVVRNVPVLVASGYGSEMMAIAKKLGTGLGLNMVGALNKPFKVSDLGTRLDEIFRRTPDSAGATDTLERTRSVNIGDAGKVQSSAFEVARPVPAQQPGAGSGVRAGEVSKTVWRGATDRNRVDYEAVVDGIVTIDRHGVVETFSPAAEHIFGYAAGEVVGRELTVLMPEQVRGEYDRYLKRFLARRDSKSIGAGYEVTGQRKDGSEFPMNLSITEVEIAGRGMLTGIVRDITVRKEAEVRLAAIMASVNRSLLVAEYAMDGTILTANDLFCDAMGYSLSEVQGESHRIFVDPEEASGHAYRAFWSALGEGRFQSGEYRCIARDGNEIWIQATFTPILDPNGMPVRVVKFATDVSETVANRKRIRDNEARARAVVDTVADGIITIDSSGTVETFNPGSERLFGYESSEVIGQKVNMLMPEPYCSAHDRFLEKYLDTGKARIIGKGREVEGLRKDGSSFAMELAVSEMEVSGKRMFTGVVRDISELKRNTEELNRLNESLSERVAALDALNEINSLLYEMNGFFHAAETEEELHAVLAKYCEILFEGKVGAYFGAASKNVLERAAVWGGRFDGDAVFMLGDCWALRQDELKITTDPSDPLKCRHFGSVDLRSAICCPVSARDGVIGLITLYATDTVEEDTEAVRRDADVLSSVAERLGTAIANLRLRERLHQDSMRDPLTQLFNRRFFDEILEIEVRRAVRTHTPISMVMLDVDRFKDFNDRHGHDAGDQALRSLASVLRETCRKEDIPCRYGGEEFALVLIGLDKEAAAQKAEVIRESIEHMEIEYQGAALPRLTISCGVAAIPKDAEDQVSCLRRADDALYAAKGAGRNRVVAAP